MVINICENYELLEILSFFIDFSNNFFIFFEKVYGNEF